MLQLIGIHEEAFSKELFNHSAINGAFTYFKQKIMTKNNLLKSAPKDEEEPDS